MNFCDPEVSDYNIRLCGIDPAGVVGIGLIEINETPTEEQLQSANFWITKTAEDPKRYFAIRNTRGEYNGGEAVEEEDLEGTRVVDATHQATFDSTGLAENWVYWNHIVKHLWKICIVTSGGLLYYIDKPVSIYTKINNQKSIKAQAFYQSEMKWADLANPIILDAPEGVFAGDDPIFIGDGGFDYTLDFSFV